MVSARPSWPALPVVVPPAFAARNPLIARKPASAPGWAYQGEIPFDPETLDSDLLTLFNDGHYFVEVRERGEFRSGMLKTVGDPASLETMMPPAASPVIVQEHATPPPDPLKDAKAQTHIMESVISAATRLIEAQAIAQPVQPVKPPSLKERLEELKLMQQMFAPQQPQQQQHDPLEKLASALEGETLKRILSTIKSENPIAPAEPPTSFWDFAAQAAEYLAPGLNPLLAGLGQWLLNSIPSVQAPQQQKQQQRPTPPRPLPSPQPQPPAATSDAADEQLPETGEEPATEEEGVSIQFLIQDLIANTPTDQTAAKVKELMRTRPFVRPFLKQYLAKDNAAIWEELIGLCETEQEAATLREGLASCTWKEDWLNSLKQHLQQ